MLTLNSVLRRLDEMKPEVLEGIQKATEAKLLAVAEEHLGAAKRLVIRDLVATDVEEATNEYFEETIADSAWATISVSDAVVNDNRFLAISGVRLLLETTGGGYILTPLVTALRFTVGGSIVAMWDLYKLYVRVGAATTAGTSALPSLVGIAEAPIIITQNTPFAIEAFGTASGKAIVVYQGLVCEPEGLTLKP